MPKRGVVICTLVDKIHMSIKRSEVLRRTVRKALNFHLMAR